MDEFEKIVGIAVKRIPKRFKIILKKEGIRLLAREKVPPAMRSRTDALIFGMFIGVPYTSRSVFNSQSQPTRIELYKDSFEKAFNVSEEMERQIAVTVTHEIGHYFGFSESKLRSLGF